MSAQRAMIIGQIRKLYADTSVERSKTKADLEAIALTVEELLQTLDDVESEEE